MRFQVAFFALVFEPIKRAVKSCRITIMSIQMVNLHTGNGETTTFAGFAELMRAQAHLIAHYDPSF